jgi:hypothetical protein
MKKRRIEGLLRAYNETLNAVRGYVWKSVRWKRIEIKGKNQFNLQEG